MDTKTNNNQISENGTDLRDLIIVLWKNKKKIISGTLIAAFITGMISMFIITPVYQSNLNIVINMPDTLVTKYGEYTLPITTNDQYIRQITSNMILLNTIKEMDYDTNKITYESLKNNILVDPIIAINKEEQNSFDVRVLAKNPAEAQQLAQTLYDNYIEYLNIMIVEGAVKFYHNNINIQLIANLDSLEWEKKVLEQNEAILKETPKIIDQKEAMKEIVNMTNTSDFVVLEDIINPNYTEVENTIIKNKQSINQYQNSIDLYNKNINELQALEDKISNYYATGEYFDVIDTLGNTAKTNIYLPSKPTKPLTKTSPSNSTNVIIGAFIGFIATIGIILIWEYWFKKSEVKGA